MAIENLELNKVSIYLSSFVTYDNRFIYNPVIFKLTSWKRNLLKLSFKRQLRKCCIKICLKFPESYKHSIYATSTR